MNMPLVLAIVLIVVAAIAAGAAGFVIGVSHRKKVAESKIRSAEAEASRIVTEAISQADSAKKEALLEARDTIHKERTNAENELRERRSEIQKQEHRLNQREENLDKRTNNLDKKEDAIDTKLKEAEGKLAEAEILRKSQLEKLESISGLTKDQARDYILKLLEEDLVREKAKKITEYEQLLKEDEDRIARELVSRAIQRSAAEQVSDITVSVVALPNDEMKGRIIGREGRNIRTLETITGADLIIDDTPEAITVSCFDPVRREIARITLEKLIADGRIHPARVEEMHEKAKREVEFAIKQAGEKACMDVGVTNLHPELVKLLGKLRYRTSYGQNVLNHSVEVAQFAGYMAAELGADVKLAKRAGLLHDIGKALDHEQEGTHIELGVENARKYKENEKVIHAIQAHHGDIEAKTVVAWLVQAADAISAARPGARRENLENYIKRLEKLEEIAKSFDGVEGSYAIQGGREIRVLVRPEAVDDDKMVILARDVVRKIEDELEYPGQIKVNVIRESKVVDFAK